MRRTLISLIIIGLTLIVFGSSSILKSKAKGEATVVAQQAQPGTRCTRLMFGPRPKKKKTEKEIAAAKNSGAMPGTRCVRLSSGGRPGTILPNTPPNVGVAASTAYIATNANAQVNLKTIACDPDGDNILYTYSASGGRITGDGATATWNLSGVARPGTYTVTVEVDDGCGCIAFDSSEVTLE
jgi:PKD domain-containing protein